MSDNEIDRLRTENDQLKAECAAARTLTEEYGGVLKARTRLAAEIQQNKELHQSRNECLDDLAALRAEHARIVQERDEALQQINCVSMHQFLSVKAGADANRERVQQAEARLAAVQAALQRMWDALAESYQPLRRIRTALGEAWAVIQAEVPAQGEK